MDNRPDLTQGRANDTGAGTFSPAHLLHVVWRYKWGIAGLAVAATVLTALYLSTVQPVYRATGSIVLESQAPNIVAVQEVYSLGRVSYDYSQTQFGILKSRQLAERTVRRLNLQDNAAFSASPQQPEKARWFDFLLPARKQAPRKNIDPELADQQRVLAIANRLARSISVAPEQYSHLVHLSYESTDPQLAAEIINTHIDEFISRDLETRVSGTVDATEWLTERLATLKENLNTSERALQVFRESEQLVDVGGVTDLGGFELKDLASRLEEARRQRILAENIVREVTEREQSSPQALSSLPVVLQHPLVQGLKQEQSSIERRVAELAKRYGPRHPRMISARSELESAEKDLGRAVEEVVAGIGREYELARRNEQELESLWQSRRSEIQQFNRIEFKLRELQRDVDTNRQLYEIFLTRLKETSSTEGFARPHARVVDAAVVPRSPIRPNKLQSMIIAFVLASMLGTLIALALDYLDNTLKTADDVQSKLGAPFLGSIPIGGLVDGELEPYWKNPGGRFGEAFRTLRTALVLSRLDDPAGVIVVTSSLPAEGKSTIALNLGSAFAQMQRTLVVGADLRRPSLARLCNLKPNHMGLSHYVAGGASLDECIEHLPEPGMDVMPAGVIPPNPLELISSARFRSVLEELRARYDRIIIDSAPVHAVSDALMLSSYADAVVFVVKADATQVTQARRALEQITGSNEPLSGVVINQLDSRRQPRYMRGKDDHYDSYYAEEADGKPA